MRHLLIPLLLLAFGSILYCQKGTLTNAEAYGIQVSRISCDYPENPSGQLILIKRTDASKPDTFPWLFYKNDSLQILFNDTLMSIFKCGRHELIVGRYGKEGISQVKETGLFLSILDVIGMPLAGKEYQYFAYKLLDASLFSITAYSTCYDSDQPQQQNRLISDKRYRIVLNKKPYPRANEDMPGSIIISNPIEQLLEEIK